MINIDTVIESLPTLTDTKLAIWTTNADRVIARGPRRNPTYADAVRLRDAIEVFQATRPAESDLIAVCGLDWDRMVKGRVRFRGFDGDQLVARIIRARLRKFTVEVCGTAMSCTYATLSEARAAAAEELKLRAQNARAAGPEAA